MTIPAHHRAAMAEHVYGSDDHPVPFAVNASLLLEGREYKILKITDHPSGYQGAIYQDRSTGELIVAHRGTEFDRQLREDGTANLAMTVTRINPQLHAASALTDEAERMARDRDQWPEGVTREPDVSHTGHSLGGFLAQCEAAKRGQGGASFNAFGCAGIGLAPEGIVPGNPPFHSCVRVSDVVGSSSRHYGDVVTFATEQDLATVNRFGIARAGTEGPVGFFANVLTDLQDRHAIKGFTEGGLMTEANRQRYLDDKPKFAEYTQSVHQGREWVTVAAHVALAA